MDVWKREDIIDGRKFLRRWKGREGGHPTHRCGCNRMEDREDGGERRGLISLGASKNMYSPVVYYMDGATFKGLDMHPLSTPSLP